jgi:ABC-type antimicrobial peptide transport system permease subunit
MKVNPPKRPLQFLRWFCREDYLEEIEGDLTEIFIKEVDTSPRKAKWKFAWRIIKYLRPEFMKSLKNYQPNSLRMYRSYFKIGWRNLVDEKGYSLINIGGLALGIAVAMLIGLWVHDELSFDKHQENYNQVAAVLQNGTIDGNIETWSSQSYQLGFELRNNFGNYFKHVVMSTFPSGAILADREKVINVVGTFMEEDGPELLSLEMLHGTRASLNDPSSLLLSASVAATLFGTEDPLGKVVKLDNDIDLKVTGVYKDIPDNSSFKGELFFIAPLEIIKNRGRRNFGWGNNWLQVFVQVAENSDMQQASLAIKDAKIKNVNENDKRFKPELFLHPLSKWHLYSDFKNGVNSGGHIEFVWLFGSIGGFVLLLACINFMNLSTARSQKRSKEIGVRKVIGSGRGQLIQQFLIESLLVVILAFAFAILLVYLMLPWFNSIAAKNIRIDWANSSLWLSCIVLLILIAFVSGSYPSFYLSAFKPIKVLKGTFRIGRYASLTRKALVVMQFTISVVLIIGTFVVYQQIQFAKSRPIGYDLRGLITVPIQTKEVKKNYTVLRNDLMASGMFTEISASETTVANLWWSDWGFEWKGKDPALQDNVYRGAIDYDFGKTVGWNIKQGRDFSRSFPSDSAAMILNEAAVKYMGFDNPIGESIRAYGKTYTVIGVIEDMVTQSLYESNKQTVFVLDPFNNANFINIKINPQFEVTKAIEELNRIFVNHNPGTPFEYRFTDDEFADKFSFEARVGKLVGIFTVLAIFISCLGLFGLASFVVEQRTKEIGIRKVLGASVSGLWKMLSMDFIVLVFIACFIAIPIGYYFTSDWLQHYDYRTEISAGVFLISGVGAIMITLLTISFQVVKAALTNPVDSLKSE